MVNVEDFSENDRAIVERAKRFVHAYDLIKKHFVTLEEPLLIEVTKYALAGGEPVRKSARQLKPEEAEALRKLEWYASKSGNGEWTYLKNRDGAPIEGIGIEAFAKEGGARYYDSEYNYAVSKDGRFISRYKAFKQASLEAGART